MAFGRLAAIHLYGLSLEGSFGDAREGFRAVRRLAGGRGVVVAVSPRARAGGVREGMTVVEARARLPDLELKEGDGGGERRLLLGAAEVLLAFSSVIEIVAPDLLLLELGASRACLADRGFTDEPVIASAIIEQLSRIGHVAHVAIADDADTARTLVQQVTAEAHKLGAKPRRGHKAETTALAPVGGARGALAALPLAALAWTEEAADPDGKLAQRLLSAITSLRLLGVNEIGHLADFPADQVAARFGDAGALLMARARGERARPLAGFEPAPELVERFELDGAVTDLEPILFVLKRLLDRLAARMEARGLAASGLELSFLLDPSRRVERLRIGLARPSRNARSFLRLCRERIDQALPEGTRELAVEVLAPVSDHGAQLELFSGRAQRIEKVEELIARLSASLGEQAVFSAALSDTHRPEAAWRVKPFAIEAAFEEPRPVQRAVKKIAAALPLVRRQGRGVPTLPEASESLAVLGAIDVGAPAPVTAGDWPKPVKRTKEDEPLPPLPPRPLELLAAPEPARLEGERLHWRGQSCGVRDLARRERLECEWWRPAPLLREYVTIDLEDGRRLWAFFDLSALGGLFVHGIFD